MIAIKRVVDVPEGEPCPGIADVRTRSEFGRELTRVRQAAGLTVRDVARSVGVPASTLGGYFAGSHLPPIKPPDLLRRILETCGITDPSVLERWERALVRARRAPGPRPAGAPVPYRGLDYFEVRHAEWFYGRERLVADLVDRVVESVDGALLTVVGASGSGKSSLLNAGLLAALGTTPMAHRWCSLNITPGPRPLLALAARLAPLVGNLASVVTEMLMADPRQLRELMGAVAQSSGSPDKPRRTLLVVDQFEEVFTSCQDEAERAAFIQALSAAASPEESASAGGYVGGPPSVVVLGLRADFYDVALRYPQIAEALQRKQTIVGPMAREEVRRAVVEPARRAKLDLDEALVDVLMGDLNAGHHGDPGAAHDAGALPLLSHALLTAWQRGRGSRLTVADYRETGGIRSLVAHMAEETYSALTAAQQKVARRLFLRLVQVSDESVDTRRYVPHTEIRLLGQTAQHVVDAFIRCRLLTAEADRIAITHEALLFAWPRLRSWIDEDRAGLHIHRQLTAAANMWQDRGRDPHELYRGGRLATVRKWALDPVHLADLTPLEREFLDASIVHELAEQRAVRRRSRVLRQLVAALTVLSALVVASASYVLRQKQVNGRVAESDNRPPGRHRSLIGGHRAEEAARLAVIAASDAYAPALPQ